MCIVRFFCVGMRAAIDKQPHQLPQPKSEREREMDRENPRENSKRPFTNADKVNEKL